MSDDGFAIHLKSRRVEAGLSLSAAAEKTGVSKAMLGQIERGESCPTLSTLWKICKGLDLALTSLIDIPPTELAPKIAGSPEFKTLHPYDPNTRSEVFLHNLAPGWEHISEGHAKGVREDIFVLEGRVEILVSEAWQRLEAGDTLRFAADIQHGYRNPTDVPAQFHNVIYYP